MGKHKRLISFLFIASFFFSSCVYEKKSAQINHLELGTYFIVSSRYKNAEYIDMMNYDQNGTLINSSHIYTGGSWKSDYINDIILIQGGFELLLINQKNNEVYTVSGERSIDYAYLNDEMLVFTMQYGYYPNPDVFRTDVCKIDLKEFETNPHISEYDCQSINETSLDISIHNDSIIVRTSNMNSEESLIYLNEDLIITNTISIPTSGAYFLSNHQDVILYNGYDYYFPDTQESLTSEASQKSFTFVYNYKDSFLRTNYIMPSTEIYIERIVDGKVESELIIPTSKIKKTIQGIGQSGVISLLESSSEEKIVRFFNIENKAYLDFTYEVSDGEDIICAYYFD